MATLNLVITKLHFPNNAPIAAPITITLNIAPFSTGIFSLIEDNVLVNVDGTINASPLPVASIDPTQRYILQAINKECGFIYNQEVILYPYCPPGYQLSQDETYCFYQVVIPATPPTGIPQTLVSQTYASYSTCGAYIYSPGYLTNGTGASSQIPVSNPFWVNGAGACVDNDTSHGPLNRAGVWTASPMAGQQIGFSVCLNIGSDATYYIGIGTDNYGIIKLDGNLIVQQDPAALAIEYPLAGALACFRIWHIYPVFIPAGNHILEILGYNISGPAAIGCEVYANTAAQIAAATSYAGLNLVFSSMNYIGQTVVIGNLNTGYSCPAGYALSACSSPFECVQTVTTPILY